jgi:hypothetical protein
MELKTIRGLREEIEKSTYYQSKKRGSDKLILIDKCNWVISKIINLVFREKVEDDKAMFLFQNISSDTLKHYLGNAYYKDILELLENKNYIVINGKYSSGNYSKSYRLSKKSIIKGFVDDEVKSNSFQKKLRTSIKKESVAASNDPLFKKLYNNLLKVKFLVEDYIYLVENTFDYVSINSDEFGKVTIPVSNKFKEARYKVYYDDLRKLEHTKTVKDCFSFQMNYRPSIAKSGRVYYTVASIPKTLRQLIVTKQDDDIYEVDMTSAQLSILFLDYLDNNWDGGDLKSLNKESRLMLTLLVEGNIYQYVQDNSRVYGNYERDDVKEIILITLNAEVNDNIFNKELGRLFPKFMSWINLIKTEKGYKTVSATGQSIEASIFVNVYRSLPNDLFALPIHDCIISTQDGVEQIKKLLIKRVRELYPRILTPNYKLDKLFKIKKVTIDSDKRESVRHRRFSEEEQAVLNYKGLKRPYLKGISF